MKKHTLRALFLIVSLSLLPQDAIGNRRSAKHRQTKSTTKAFLAGLCVALAAQSCVTIPTLVAAHAQQNSSGIEAKIDSAGRIYDGFYPTTEDALCQIILAGDKDPSVRQRYLIETIERICRKYPHDRTPLCIETCEELKSMSEDLRHEHIIRDIFIDIPLIDKALKAIEKILAEQKDLKKQMTKQQRSKALERKQATVKFYAECREKKAANKKLKSSFRK